MAKREKERHYIRKHINNNYAGYQLVIPASDTKKLIYFAHGKDVDKLREIRDKILSQPHTEEDILRYKRQYRNKEVKEPMIEKYIRKTSNGKYNVRNNEKQHNGSYGVYNTLREAREIRDKLIQHNWNKEQVGIQTTRRSSKGPDRYIYKERGKYVVKRAIRDGDKQRIIRYDTSINTIEEAREIRDWWEENGWDWNAIDLY